MIKNEISLKLKNLFSDDIYLAKTINNEMHLEVNSGKIDVISAYINNELGYPLILIFANDERSLCDKFAIYYVFADRERCLLLVIKTTIDSQNAKFKSITPKVYAADCYEREIHDMFGLVSIGHPNLKKLVFHSNWLDGNFPLRKDYDLKHKPPYVKNEFHFDKVIGDGVYEIPVGPVHAGIIEPGHFRFSVAGEPIINLEAQLWFVHKGIEKMCEGESIERCLYISERISGDETFTNSLAYCLAIEKIASIQIPIRAQYTRIIFAELERLTSHLGDLAGICLDTAYGFAAFQFRMIRGWAYSIADELCGMRFLRSVNKIGGVRKDFTFQKEKSIIEQLRKIKSELEDTRNIIFSNSMFVDRIEHTGILDKDIAIDLNAVGPSARASGIRYDVRKAFPYLLYDKLDFNVPEHNNGDVNCRMKTKIEECFESIQLMITAIETMPKEKDIINPIQKVEPYKASFGITEAPRGENIHWIMTGENNTIFRYKIRTPSFCNWPALLHAVKGNIVPDFPLINKSFNLSYAGNDL